MQLSTQPATTSMIATIHVLKGQIGLDDDAYRDFLYQQAQVRTSKHLSVAAAGRVIERMREITGDRPAVKGSVAGLDTPVGSKLRALWIAGHNLGVVRARDDKAMLAFLERQTGVSHVRFLQDPRASTSAIEGLKAWLARQAAVEWPADSADVIGAKRAVLDAQWRRLIEVGEIKPIGASVDAMEGLQHYAGKIVRQNRWETFSSTDYDLVAKALGNKLRGALARREQSTSSSNEEK
jgi:Protein of unknown function (DUF1018)